MSIHTDKLRTLNTAYRTVETMQRGISKVLSEHLGIDTNVTYVAGDGICIDISEGFGGLTPLTYELLDEIMTMPPVDAIQYIKDRST